MFDEVQFTLKNREIEYDQWSDWQKVGRQLIAIFYSISVTHSTWNNVIFLITSHSAKVLVHRFTAVGGFAIMIMKYCQYIFHPLHGLFIQSIYECERIGVCVWVLKTNQTRKEKSDEYLKQKKRVQFHIVLLSICSSPFSMHLIYGWNVYFFLCYWFDIAVHVKFSSRHLCIVELYFMYATCT